MSDSATGALAGYIHVVVHEFPHIASRLEQQHSLADHCDQLAVPHAQQEGLHQGGDAFGEVVARLLASMTTSDALA